MAGPANPKQYHPAAGFNAPGIATIPLTLSADNDFTLPTSGGGPTGGYCPRQLLIGSTGGNLVYYDINGGGPWTVPVVANTYFNQAVSYLVSSGTAATPISAVL